MDKDNIGRLERDIGHKYKDIDLLKRATIHSSYANESKSILNSNERLEFLGDSVLSIVISDYLFKSFTDMPEGDLTKLRSMLVCENSLFDYATKLGLGSYLKLGKGEEQTGGRTRKSILADAFEAVIASIYLDSGTDAARDFILPYVHEKISSGKNERGLGDYKTKLQEVIQKNPEEKVEYVLIDESGPAHDKVFVVEVHLNSNIIGKGTGTSKKQAEQRAACEALELMGL